MKAGMSGLVKLFLMLLLCSAVAVTVYVVYTQVTDGPEKTLEKLENSFNDMDYNRVIECFDPTFQAQLKAVYGIAEFFMDQAGIPTMDMETMYDLLPGLVPLLGDTMDWPTMEIEVIETEYTDDYHAYVQVSMTLTADGETQSAEEVIPMKKVDDTWYIDMTKYMQAYGS